MANALANETSPYLKQHAHNPVAWMPWSDAAWNKARAEDKPVLVSIGYAACHWCHVMERESFESEAIAALMNRDFICIKVDREERPDVDQVYIEAVQLLSGHAGWPLNCFCMPDGRPVYGGTYFQPGQWTQLLRRLTVLWNEDRDSLDAQAGQLTAALRKAETVASSQPWEAERVRDQLRQGVERAKLSFDRLEGGSQRAPKFPLPVNWRFLLRYGEATGDKAVLRQVYLTLGKMADGGIHDQVGGGFARYSVDGIWKVPHFEKMLYDNGQLLGLYAQAYAAARALPPEADKVLIPAYQSDYWREVAASLAAFLHRDLGAEKGLFHASLDADSEGEEGRFYVWTREELQSLLGEDFSWFAARRGVDDRGYWEEEKHILLRCGDDGKIAADHGLTVSELRERDAKARALLLAKRAQRIAPGLDDKVLVSWNALAITGLAEAGMWLGEPAWVQAAVKAGETLMREAMQEDGGLRRSRQGGNFAIAGFLEDYAHLAWAFLRLYRATQDTLWVFAAEKLVIYAETHFSDDASGLFYFTSDLDAPLVTRKMELQDNVLPSANGVMGRCLAQLSELLERPAWKKRAETMLARILPEFSAYLLAHGGWGELALDLAAPHYLVSVLGPKARQAALDLASHPLNQALVVAEAEPGKGRRLPCLQGVDGGNRDLFVVCLEGSCLAPMDKPATALEAMPAHFI